MSSGRSYLRSGLRALWWLAAGVVITVAALLSAVRLLLPYAGAYHADVARWVGAVLEHPVEIGGLDAGWHGLGPSIELAGVEAADLDRMLQHGTAPARDVGVVGAGVRQQ